MKLQFGTWNIGHINKTNTSEDDNNHYIIEVVKSNSLNVICLQEVIIKSKDSSSQLQQIKSGLNCEYYVEQQLVDTWSKNGAIYGNAILSFFPITLVDKKILDNPAIKYKREGLSFLSHDKGFLCISLNDILIINAHLYPFHSFNKDEKNYKYIYSEFERSILKLCNKKKTIIGADFNTKHISQLMPKLADEFNILINGPTRPSGRADDNILVNNGSEVESVNIIRTDSDHYLCACTIDLGE